MRDHIIRIRASDRELAAMKDLAATQGLSLSVMMRNAALGVRIPPSRFDHTHTQLLAQTLGALGQIGGLLNQLVRRANIGKLMGHNVELTRTLEDINTLRIQIRQMIN